MVSDWITEDEPPYIQYDAGSMPKNAYPWVRRGEDEGPDLTPDEELRLLTKQITETQVLVNPFFGKSQCYRKRF